VKKPEKPFPPCEHNDDFTEKSYHKTTFIHEETDEDCLIDNYFNDGLEGLNIQELVYDNFVIDLKSLLAKIPKDADPSKVKIYLRRPRMMDYFQIDVIEEVAIDKKKQKAEYDVAMEKYKKKLEVYKIMRKEFDEWYKKEKIKHHTEELERLTK